MSQRRRDYLTVKASVAVDIISERVEVICADFLFEAELCGAKFKWRRTAERSTWPNCD